MVVTNRLRKCTKKKYTYIQGQEALIRLSKSHPDREQRCYFCRECHAYHLTSRLVNRKERRK